MSDKRMGELFAQDQVPLPRRDPRSPGQPRYPQGQLSVDAGVGHMGRGPFQYGKPTSYIARSPEELGAIREEHDRMLSRMGRGEINPELFSDMLTRQQESPNAVWMFDDRFRGM